MLTFMGKHLAHPPAAIFGAQPLGGDLLAPRRGLSIQIGKVGKFTRRKEAVADVANGALDASFLIAPGHCHRARLEATVRSKLQQGGVEVNGLADAFEHRAFKIVVE